VSRRWPAASLLVGALALGCRTQSPAASAAQPAPFGRGGGTPSGRAWLAKDSARARAAGAGESQVLTVQAGAAGDRVSSMLSVPETGCALLVARATDSIDDLDLYAYGEDGAMLGTDESPDRTPTLMVCPPHPKRIFVVARIAAGHGLVALGAQQVDPRDAERVGRATGAHGHPGEAQGRAEAWPGLTERLAEHRRQIGGAWQELRKVAIPIEPRVATRLSATVEAERCLDVLVIPSEDASYLDVDVLDASGRIMGRAAATGRDRSLIVCSPIQAVVTIEVRPHAGRGLAAVVTSRSVPGSERDIAAGPVRIEIAPTGDLEQTRSTNAERLSARGYAQAKVLGQGQLHVGRRVSLSLDLPNGCARVDVLSGRPVRGVEAWLWNDRGALVATERGSGQVPLFACQTGGKARLDVEAIAQPGRYAVELRTERNAPKILSEQPLAAGRLLTRMFERGVIHNAEQAGAVRSAELSPTRLYRENLLVPFGRCIDVSLALGPGASGAEIRIANAADGEELALSRGTFSTSARACALGQTRTTQAMVEMRTVAGTTTALVATRMLAPKD
jgi:hypothetical protein